MIFGVVVVEQRRHRNILAGDTFCATVVNGARVVELAPGRRRRRGGPGPCGPGPGQPVASRPARRYRKADVDSHAKRGREPPIPV